MNQLVKSSQEDELLFNAGEIKEQMRTNLDAMAAICLPEICTDKFSPTHHNIWNLLVEGIEGFERLLKYAIALPRGHAKTQLDRDWETDSSHCI